MEALSATELTGLELLYRGKVRDIYRLDEERLLLVATDRVSAFDCVMGQPIPRKGQVLTQLSVHWFQALPDDQPHHLLSGRPEDEVPELAAWREQLGGRAMLVQRTEPVPVECVVRGYLAGSVWKEYSSQGTVRGVPVAEGLELGGPLPAPIFTPAIKAKSGHDEDILFEEVVRRHGESLATELRRRSLEIYRFGAAYARDRSIVLADTKFEFGHTPDGQLLLIDEVMTPDSSRFWPLDQISPGRLPPSLDKQILRNHLLEVGFKGDGEPPQLPDDLIERLTEQYCDIFEQLVGRSLDEVLA